MAEDAGVSRAQAEELLRVATGLANISFRDGQWEAIDQLVNSRGRALVVQRTGWGKSMVYFLSARLLRDAGAGPALIVSPLLALMRNQMEAAQRLGLRPVTINSSNVNEWAAAKADLLADKADLLLISPERLANDGFVADVLLPIAARIGLVVVDEAHCISDWGHDFRPDYRRIVQILRQLPRNVAVLGTTATANKRVVADVETQLGPGLKVQRGPLARDTLSLQVLRMPNPAARLAWLADYMDQLPGSGIVYALTVRDADRVAEWLAERGVRAAAYHAAVDSDVRVALEQRLLANELKCLVATTALGMGFDKPDLGFVVHFQMPGSVVFYYQQVGRAGRAIEKAYGVLMSGDEDEDINAYFRNQAFPPEEHVSAILRALEQAQDGLGTRALEAQVNLRQGQIEKVLKLLVMEDSAPVISEGSKWYRTANPYAMDAARMSHLTRQREQEWAEMQAYMASRNCLMQFLARALDDEAAGPCGRCAVCTGKPVLPVTLRATTLSEAQRFLRHSETPLEPKKQWAAGAFALYGWSGANIPANLRAEEGRVLARWGEMGWGELVRDGKQAGVLPDALVGAVAEMVQQRWPDVRGIRWVTCVPSLRHPTLVSEFAARLARALAVPYLPIVRKIRETHPQKGMENRYHQCRNLDGAFAVERTSASIAEPVLLVDDVTDSGWTLAVVAALLCEAGSGPVFPLALASASAE